MEGADAWIDTVLSRAGELRRAGVLSIGWSGCSVVLAPYDPADAPVEDAKKQDPDEDDGPRNAWEDGASYPSGRAPSIDRDEGELPPIPILGDS